MMALDRDIDGWEHLAQDRSRWRQELNRSLRRWERKLQLVSDERRVRRKNDQQSPSADIAFKCSRCDRDCPFRIITTHSHKRRCSRAK